MSYTEVYLMFMQQNIGSMYTIYGNMDPINIPPMLVYIYIYIPYMDPMGNGGGKWK